MYQLGCFEPPPPACAIHRCAHSSKDSFATPDACLHGTDVASVPAVCHASLLSCSFSPLLTWGLRSRPNT